MTPRAFRKPLHSLGGPLSRPPDLLPTLPMYRSDLSLSSPTAPASLARGPGLRRLHRLAVGAVLLSLAALQACAPLPAATATTAGAPACPPAAAPGSQSLYGQWLVQVDGQPEGRMTLQRHPEYAGSVSGTLAREGQTGTSRVAGDIDQGLVALEESADGKTTSGRWSGEFVAPACDSEIRGTWLDAQAESAALSSPDNKIKLRPHAFVMRLSLIHI